MTRPARYSYVGEIVAYEPDGPRNPEPEEDLRNCLRDALFRSSKPIIFDEFVLAAILLCHMSSLFATKGMGFRRYCSG